MHKIVIAITGASGSIYAKLIIEKLLTVKSQWQALAVVMSDNAKSVWQHELGDNSFANYQLPFLIKMISQLPLQAAAQATTS
jgi:flavin prenyltransferase